MKLPLSTESQLVSLSGARIIIKSIKGEHDNPYADAMLESIKNEGNPKTKVKKNGKKQIPKS